MKTVLNNIIKCNQTAYVKGRYIGESIQLVTDILDYTAEHEEVEILFSVACEHALSSCQSSSSFISNFSYIHNH